MIQNNFRRLRRVATGLSVLALLAAVVISSSAGQANRTAGQQGQGGMGAQQSADKKSFFSAKLGHEVFYSVQLPPSYESSKKRYPVVIFLHGLFENESAWQRHGADAV